MGKRNSQLQELTVVAQNDYLTIVDTSAGQSKRVSVKTLVGNVDLGWVATGESWTFSSWSSTTLFGIVTVPSDATLKYSVGMRVRFSQTTGGTKYATIVAVTTSTLTLVFAAAATLANETITSPVYSPLKAPYSGSVALSDDTDSFSTTEVATPYRWVDGKIIYKRTFTGTISQAAGTRNLITLFASGIDKVIRYEGYYDEGGALYVTLGSARMATDGTVNGADTVWNNGGAVAFLTKSAATRTNAPYAVTVFYTK